MKNLNHCRKMKTTVKLFAAGLLLARAGSTLADVRYVDVNSTNATPPFTDCRRRVTPCAPMAGRGLPALPKKRKKKSNQ